MCAYHDTPNKQTIRRDWNGPLLAQWKARIAHPLTYFGLPGPELKDLLDWREWLDPCRTGVQSLGRTKRERGEAEEMIGRLNANLFGFGIDSGFQLLRGNVEDVILNAIDHDGNPPQLNDGRPAHLTRFTYDLVNLDFNSGLGYRTKDGAKRVEALRKLFERQRGQAFILLLTINVRDTLSDTVEEYLRNLRDLKYGPDWRDLLDWYLGRGEGERQYKLKAVVPSFLRAAAELYGFQCLCHPPIFYVGHESAHMIHYACEFTPQLIEDRVVELRAFSQQDDRDLVQLPLLLSKDGRLRLAAHQHPDFDPDRCSSYGTFLPAEIHAEVFGGRPLIVPGVRGA